MESNGSDTFSPTPEHRAIDQASALILGVERLRRTLDQSGVLHHDDYRELLDRIAADLHRLAASLRTGGSEAATGT